MMNAIDATSATPSVSPIRQYPENLSEIIEDKEGNYTQEQRSAAGDKRNAREYQAFGRFGAGFEGDGSAKSIKKFLESYVKFLDQLSPEEQNSDRYRGTREPVKALIPHFTAAAAKEQLAPDPKKKPEELDDPLLKMLRVTAEEIQKQLKVKPSEAAGQQRTTISDVVTLSEEARKLAASGE